MNRLHRNLNVAGVVLPFLAFLVAVPMLWNDLIGWSDVGLLVALYLLSGIGVPVGFHRLLTHRAFETYRPIKYAFAVLGSVAVQGPVIEDRGMVWISRNFAWLVGRRLPGRLGLGHALMGELAGALTALLWGGLVRVFFLHQVTWSINSMRHFFGRRRFSTEDRSTNVF